MTYIRIPYQPEQGKLGGEQGTRDAITKERGSQGRQIVRDLSFSGPAAVRRFKSWTGFVQERTRWELRRAV
jgi:hypothetical protein